ncbi:fungal specific transcription factor domain protein [Penicillium taxi]|uniref:fungal specific transcription factor domain protein n=1 Tax=Penicillium taxi TaxID=168475 RepID=UPI00254515C7|nr:fungal specific transcription factor domain protein [Penicillium taxi]KAJ5888344.1 fungal specific transcription factor domain protein [Penicillium taxi]
MPDSIHHVDGMTQQPTPSTTSSSGRLQPPRSRRRDKPQLSCSSCRRRKARCDRHHPCANCSSRGLGSSCVYTNISNSVVSFPAESGSPSHPQISATNTQDRINQLESLVLELMHQTESNRRKSNIRLSQAPRLPRAWNFKSLKTFFVRGKSTKLEKADLVVDGSPSTNPQHLTPDQRAHGDRADSRKGSKRAAEVGYEAQNDASPSPSEYGSFRTPEIGANYVSSSHWSAILDSITNLRNYIARDEEIHPRVLDPVQPSAGFPKPQLLYSSAMHETSASILKNLPPRLTVDRLVSRYFNSLDIAPGIVHSGKFLREYEVFWKAPHDTPILWVGILFSIMCLSTQLQQAFSSLENSTPSYGHPRQTSQVGDSEDLSTMYKVKAIQCLLLGHYTKGGPYDMEIGIWVLVGNIVQIAIHMGYHRDAKHFASISPFAGEMRRRIWAMIVQLDFSVSTQLGLPRLIKESDTDTAEPRNLNDSDFDEHTSTLPASKPETEVTPTLYVLAKLRLLSVGANVADVAMQPQPHPYAEIMELDQRIEEARKKIPSSLKWTGLGSSLNVPSRIIVQRIWLEVIIHQLKIVLHRKFLEPSRFDQQYDRSRSACLEAAMQILNFQRLVDEETSPDGLLYQSRWMVSSAFTNDFLLATSVLCFYLQAHNKKDKSPNNLIDSDLELDMEKIRELLKTSQTIWRRQCATSREALKAITALDYVLDGPHGRPELSISENASLSAVPATAVSYFSGKDIPSFPAARMSYQQLTGHMDFTSNYDLSSMALAPEMEGIAWPMFTTNMNNDVERWIGSQQMDMAL